MADRFIGTACIHAIALSERAASFVIGFGVMKCHTCSTFIIKSGLDKSWNSLRLAFVGFGLFFYGSGICRMADRLTE